MATALQRDIGILSRHEKPDFSDSRSRFMHAIFQGLGGPCSMLPVLFTAIGRRFGYPLKLALAPEHLFARWEDPSGETFDIECTALGLKIPDDGYYMLWPMTLPPEHVEHTIYLKSMTPREELAVFLMQRAHCLALTNRNKEAIECALLAHRFAPTHFPHQVGVEEFLEWWDIRLGFIPVCSDVRLYWGLIEDPAAGQRLELAQLRARWHAIRPKKAPLFQVDREFAYRSGRERGAFA